ncbi:probable ergosterol biosynthetic protein 28 [Asterias rubens]|uniref:probable ergosterol biosynthetic protein 28 n=1 Tax=Asterias rubens TaxID=7604 RepID=UPI001455C890|nr:probable ergosterol biosynthetic protein 28 [Asterias rubens]XP_033647725.1 probable ergosterol biosynthetic protein 28 [Asterias rubens]
MKSLVRVWVGIVGLTAIVTSLQSFIDSSFLAERIYTLDKDSVTPALGRLFGTWTCLAGVVRILCAVFITSKPLYFATTYSFVLAFAYFASELLIFKTVELSAGVISPLIVAGGSTVLMLLAYRGIMDQQNLQTKKH